MSNSNLRILLLCLLITGFVGCKGGEKGISPELRDKIVFVSEQGICTINPDGTDLKVIVPTEKGGPFLNPRWSPDKMWLAFTSSREPGHGAIVLVKSDGSELRTLGGLKQSEATGKRKESGMLRAGPGGYDLSFIAWSPDGKHMLSYPPPCPDCAEFLLIDRKGKRVLELHGLWPAFCGEDKVVYVVAGPGMAARSDIFSYNLKNKEKTNVTHDGKYMYYLPVPSPDCLRVAFGFGDFWLNNELWVMDSDGSHRRRLVSQNKDFVGGPLRVISFSPDGSKILFVPDNGDKSNLYIPSLDGSNLSSLANGIVNASGGAAWSPDGKRIVFVSDKDGDDQLYIVNSDGTGLTRLTKNTTKNLYPDW